MAAPKKTPRSFKPKSTKSRKSVNAKSVTRKAAKANDSAKPRKLPKPPSAIEQHVIDKVKAKRTEKDNFYSQSSLSVELGLSKGFIGNVESPKERAKYNLNHINALARIFGCSPRDFLPDKPL